MVTTSTSYRLIAKDLDASLARTEAEKPVARETDYYAANIGNVKSIDDFLKDTRLFNYAMKAFGLEDMAYAKAFMRKILTEGVTDTSSFANRLDDDRFLQFAKTFDFADDGDATTASTDVKQGVVDKYVRQTMEDEAGSDDQGVQLALYFQRQAPKVASVYGLLADTALWQVVKTVYGFPDAMALAPIEQQAAAVSARLNIADLQDPDKLNALLQRFTTMYDIAQTATSDPVLALFDVNSTTSTVDFDLAMTLNNLKHGGT